MITSKKLSPERIEEIKSFPVSYDEDSPKLTVEQLVCMKPRKSISEKISFLETI